MRILMETGGHDLMNIGDWAMLLVAVRRFRELFPGCVIHVLVNDPARLACTLPDAIPLPAAGRQAALGTGRHIPAWERRLMRWLPNSAMRMRRRRRRAAGEPTADIDRFIQEIRACDLVVATGGGYITDAFPWMTVNVCGFLALAHRLGKPTAMFGQGLGPLLDPALRGLASGAMKNLSVLCLREGLLSPPLAAELGVPPQRVQVTGDDTIEWAYHSRPQRLGPNLGINVRRADYAGVADADLQAIQPALARLIADLGAPQIAIIPISQAVGEEDWRHTAAVLPPDKRPIPKSFPQPEDVVEDVGRCRLVITGSYHSAVFALAQGIPAIGLAKSDYYRDKFRGLAHQFGEGCRTLDMNDPRFSPALQAAARQLWDRADLLRPWLIARAEDQIARSRRAYQMMAQQMKSAA